MYGELLRLVADDNELGGQTVPVLAGHEEDSGPSALALRLLGSVHRLVLSGEVPELAVFYPSVGGEWDPVFGWDAFQQVLESHREQIRLGLDQPPQTNEVGRSAALMGGLLQLEHRLPVRLFEIGASAGLNLRADHFSYDGSPSEVDLTGCWQGRAIRSWPELAVVERAGCDIAPVDPTTDDGALTLLSYVWPDQTERVARLRGAIQIARKVPAEVRRQDAASFVRELAPADGTVTVLWHSIMWQYLTTDQQHEVAAAIDGLGAAATEDRPVAHLSFEPAFLGDNDYTCQVTLRSWPSGDERLLGTAAPHGVPVVWA